MLDGELERDSRSSKQTACRGEGLNFFRGKKQEVECEEAEVDPSGSKDGFLGRSLSRAAGLGGRKGRLKLHVPPAATRLTTVDLCCFFFDLEADPDLDECRKYHGEISCPL